MRDSRLQRGLSEGVLGRLMESISWASVVATAMERPFVSSYNMFQHK